MIGSPTRTDLGTNSLLGDPTDSLTLRVRGTDHDGQLIRVDTKKCTIGSADTCGLRLRMNGVDPLHCVIVRGQNGTAIRRWAADTRLNGATFDQAWLTPGDRLTVGSIEFDVLDAIQADANEEDVLKVSDAPRGGDFDALIELIEKLHDQLSAQSEHVALIEGAQQSFQSEAENLAASWERLQQQLADERAHDDNESRCQAAVGEMQAQLQSRSQPLDKRLADGNDFHRSVSERLQKLRHQWEEHSEDLLEDTQHDVPSPQTADDTQPEPTASQGDFGLLRDRLESLAEKTSHIETTTCDREELWVTQQWASRVVESALARCADHIDDLARQLDEHESQLADEQHHWTEELARLEERLTARTDEAIERVTSELTASNHEHRERFAAADCHIESLHQFAEQLDTRIETLETEDVQRESSGRLDDQAGEREEIQSLRELTKQLSTQMEAVQSQQRGVLESQHAADCHIESLHQFAELLEEKIEAAETQPQGFSVADCHIESLHQFAELLEEKIEAVESQQQELRASQDNGENRDSFSAADCHIESLHQLAELLEEKIDSLQVPQGSPDLPPNSLTQEQLDFVRDQWNEQYQELAEQLNRQSRDAEELRRELNSSRVELADAASRSQVDQMGETLESLETRLQELSGRQPEFSTLDELTQLRTQLDESHRELSDRIERHSAETAVDDQVTQQLDATSNRLAELSAAAETLHERLATLETQQRESDVRRDEAASRHETWLEERFAELVQTHNESLAENSRRVEAELAQLAEMKEAFERAMAAPVERPTDQPTESFADSPLPQIEPMQPPPATDAAPALPSETQDWQPAPIPVEPEGAVDKTDRLPTPAESEDVQFHATSDAAPTSAMDVLSKVSQTEAWHAEDPTVGSTMVFNTGGEQGPSVALTSAVEQPQDAELAVADEESSGDDESIEDYMSQLLKRVRGDSKTNPDCHGASQAPPPAPKCVVEAEPVQQPVPTPVQATEELGEFFPRSQAPESSSNLAAMRELANESARDAINTSAKSRNKFKAGSRAIIAGVFGLGGAALLFISQTVGDVALYGAWGSFVIAGYVGLRALHLGMRSEARQHRAASAEARRDTSCEETE